MFDLASFCLAMFLASSFDLISDAGNKDSFGTCFFNKILWVGSAFVFCVAKGWV